MKVDIDYHRLCKWGTCNRDYFVGQWYFCRSCCVSDSLSRDCNILSINFVYIFPNNGHLSTKATFVIPPWLTVVDRFDCTITIFGQCFIGNIEKFNEWLINNGKITQHDHPTNFPNLISALIWALTNSPNLTSALSVRSIFCPLMSLCITRLACKCARPCK